MRYPMDFPEISAMTDADKNKFLGAIGLAVKARGCILGTELCVEMMRKNKGALLVVPSDISDNTKKRLFGTAVFHRIPYTYVDIPKKTLAHAAGKKSDTAAALFTQSGFVKILEKLSNPLLISNPNSDIHTTDTEVLHL